MSRPVLHVTDLGRRPYGEVLDLQRELCRRRIEGSLTEDVLLLVEHDPVVTLGRGTKAESLPLSRGALERLGVSVFEVERGGDVTYHGPGQLVGYPVLDLKNHKEDLHWYLRQLEAVLIAALAMVGIDAERNPGLTGVWTGGRKIASIGVHVRQWVTFHGFALNIDTDLLGFDMIVPCGIAGVEMTSVAREIGQARVPIEKRGFWNPTRSAVIEAFARSFQLSGRETTLSELRAEGTEAESRTL